MASIREPAVAGTFYPADAASLGRTVDQYLDAAESQPASSVPKAIIAPHAGYVYSGETAGTVYRQLLGAKNQIQRVVLLGPSHRVAFRGMAVPSATAFRTPLGDIPVDAAGIQAIVGLPQVGFLDQAPVLGVVEGGLDVELIGVLRLLELRFDQHPHLVVVM